MGLSNAERQAAYRARKRSEVAQKPENPPEARSRARILALEEEVRHLKAELASRSRVEPRPGPSFNSRPFTPVPKSR